MDFIENIPELFFLLLIVNYNLIWTRLCDDVVEIKFNLTIPVDETKFKLWMRFFKGNKGNIRETESFSVIVFAQKRHVLLL